jgi:hypothetical protein
LFVRKKGNAHYLIESRREGGKVRQKVLHYLGEFPTAEAELAHLEGCIRDCRYHAAHWRGQLEAAKSEGLDAELTQRYVTIYTRRAAEHEARAAHYEARRDDLRRVLARQT